MRVGPVVRDETSIRMHGDPVEVITDRAPALQAAIEGLMPAAFHIGEQYEPKRKTHSVHRDPIRNNATAPMGQLSNQTLIRRGDGR